MNRTYSMAYTEILEILKYLPKDEYNKIPKEKINFFEKNTDNNYTYKFDVSQCLDEQNLSPKANTIIVSLFMDYFANSNQKEQIKKILNQNEEAKQKSLREKYNPDNIFDKKANHIISESQSANEEIQLKECHKLPWYKVLINKIKSILIR